MRPNIIVCAAPKTGSSHIKLSLQKLLDYRSAYAVSDNTLYTTAAQIVFHYGEQILHHHVEATPCNVAILNRYRDEVKVVLTFRNVLDCIVSLKDYMEWPKVTLHNLDPASDWVSLTDEQKYTWVTYNWAPWYFRFWTMWQSCDVPRCEVYYEEFFKDQIAGIRKILDFAGIDDEYTDSQIEVATRHKEGKFNVGRSGRGREILPSHLIDVVYEHANSWGPYWGKMLRETLID